MKEMWDKRYGSEEYASGVEPNEFFKEKLGGLKPGKFCCPQKERAEMRYMLQN